MLMHNVIYTGIMYNFWSNEVWYKVIWWDEFSLTLFSTNGRGDACQRTLRQMYDPYCILQLLHMKTNPRWFGQPSHVFFMFCIQLPRKNIWECTCRNFSQPRLFFDTQLFPVGVFFFFRMRIVQFIQLDLSNRGLRSMMLKASTSHLPRQSLTWLQYDWATAVTFVEHSMGPNPPSLCDLLQYIYEK